MEVCGTENLNRECWKRKNGMIIIKEICQWIFNHGIQEVQEPTLPAAVVLVMIRIDIIKITGMSFKGSDHNTNKNKPD